MAGRACHGGHAWQEKLQLQRTVRILLEYILVCDENMFGSKRSYMHLIFKNSAMQTISDRISLHLREKIIQRKIR